MKKKILWLVAAIEDIGGGERLLFEGLKYYSDNSIDVQVVTWRFNKKAFFDGEYSFDNIEVLNSDTGENKSNIFKFATKRAKSFWGLYKIAKKFKPDLILCQSEYDAIFAGLLSKILRTKYSVLIFGQTYQEADDLVKYSIKWKKHLKNIINTTEGYKNSISLHPPYISFMNRLALEVVSLFRFLAVKNAYRLYSLSSRIANEQEIIHGNRPAVLKAGITRNDLENRIGLFSSNTKDKSILKLVTVSRLDKKKNIDIIVKSLKNLKLNRNWCLNIIGDGEEKSNLTGLVDKLNMNDKVIFTGRVPDKIMNKYLSESDVFISMDIGDFDVSVIEAMSFGLTILVSSDFEIDDSLANYKSIIPVMPYSREIKKTLESRNIMEIINNGPNFDPMYDLTWDNYFNTIIEDV